MFYESRIKKLIDCDLITPNRHPALYDFEFQKNLSNIPWGQWLEKKDYFNNKFEFISSIENWIVNTKNNNLKGLEKFTRKDVILGTTQSFDEAYFRYSNRRLRIFRREYAYHKRNLKNLVFIEDEPLKENDWIIISYPFSGIGDVAENIDEIFKESENLNIPILVDCAWFGTCHNIDFNFCSPAISSVSFSLSKGIGLGRMRIGIRYSNYSDGPIFQQNNFNHLVGSNMEIGIYQMKKFSSDFTCNKYKTYYNYMCNDLDLLPTKCMHVAFYKNELVGVRNLVKEYYRRLRNERIGFHDNIT